MVRVPNLSRRALGSSAGSCASGIPDGTSWAICWSTESGRRSADTRSGRELLVLAVLSWYPGSGTLSEHLVVGMMRSGFAESSWCATTHASLVTRITENSPSRKSCGSAHISEVDRIDRIVAEYSEARAIWTNVRPRSRMRMNRRSAVRAMNHLSQSARSAFRFSTDLLTSSCSSRINCGLKPLPPCSWIGDGS